MAMHKLPKMLRLEGRIVTVDAFNCQREIAQQVTSPKGGYVMVLKSEPGMLHDGVRTFPGDPQTELSVGVSTVDGDQWPHRDPDRHGLDRRIMAAGGPRGAVR